MTRSEFDNLSADGRVPCPDCGSLDVLPTKGCQKCLPAEIGMKHINKVHHVCKKEKAQKA